MKLPHIVTWQDNKPTGALGWLVIDSLINGVCSGGLFMHAEATVTEVAALAKTMTYKNGLQLPRIGGAKGGIRFNHNHPAAEEVLRRFLLDHQSYIERVWSTGADLNTNNTTINNIIYNDLGLASGFVSLSTMLNRFYGIKDQASDFYTIIQQPVSNYFTLGESATGYSIAFCIHKLCSPLSKILIQGWGNVGRSLGYFLQAKAYGTVVGIIEKDYFIYCEKGLDINKLLTIRQALNDNFSNNLETYLREIQREGYEIIRRTTLQNDEAFLAACLQKPADIFCPCANRYSITSHIGEVLEKYTFKNRKSFKPYIISGANNVFAEENLPFLLERAGISVLPEWLSNSGNTLLYNEILKLPHHSGLIDRLWLTINNRLESFIMKASEECEKRNSSLYKVCHDLMERELEPSLTS